MGLALDRHRLALGASAITGAAWAVYLPTLRSFFLSDDFVFLAIASAGIDLGAALRAVPGFIRPVAALSMMLDFSLWGFEPTGWHVTNVLLHTGNALLVAALCLRLFERRRAAFAAGMLFALHPVHPEAVSWISGRFDLTCTFFSLASILGYVEYRRRGSVRWLMASLGLALLALASKEAALALPAILLAVEWARGSDARWSRVLPHLACVLAYLVARVVWLGGLAGYTDAAGQSLHLPRSLAWMISGTLIVPFSVLLAPVNESVWEMPVVRWLSLGLHALLVGLAMLRGERSVARECSFGVAFVVLAALPASSLLAPGITPDLAGSRFLYLPSVGHSVLLGALVAALPVKLSWRALQLGVACFALATLGHNRLWRDAAVLARSIVDRTERLYPLTDCSDPTLIIRDPPDNLRGAYVFRNGMDYAVELFHARHPRTIVEWSHAPAWHPEIEAACTFVAHWRDEPGTLEDVTGAVREPPLDCARPARALRFAGARELARWSVSGASIVPGDEGELVLRVDGDDPWLESPIVRLCVRSMRLEMAIRPTGAQSDDVADVFWALPNEQFERYTSFQIARDGELHSYELPLVRRPSDLARASGMRVRLDPSSFPSLVRIRSIELVPFREAR